MKLDNYLEKGDWAIETEHLSRRFGKLLTVDAIDLKVERGSIFGLLGVNGAGKTTLIKMLMGHLRPTAGKFTILGRSLKQELVEIRKRVGYVSEDRYLYDWMTVAESLRFTRAFYENWDEQKAAALIERFDLTLNQRVKQLSRGNRARLSLVLALSYNPELILLDEPTSGLDPIVRRDFIENIISEIASRERTVLFSSHIVEEIERIADHVGIIHEGRLIVSSEIDALKSSLKRIRFATNASRPDLTGIPGLLRVDNADHDQIATLQGWSEETLHWLRQRGVVDPEVLPMSLEEIFVELAGGTRERKVSA